MGIFCAKFVEKAVEIVVCFISLILNKRFAKWIVVFDALASISLSVLFLEWLFGEFLLPSTLKYAIVAIITSFFAFVVPRALFRNNRY